jgi:hypothetical protein
MLPNIRRNPAVTTALLICTKNEPTCAAIFNMLELLVHSMFFHLTVL